MLIACSGSNVGEVKAVAVDVKVGVAGRVEGWMGGCLGARQLPHIHSILASGLSAFFFLSFFLTMTHTPHQNMWLKFCVYI